MMNKSILDTQGKRFRYIRKLTGLKRNEFANKYSLSLATVRSWEMDIAKISPRLRKKIIEIFKKELIIVHEEWITNAQPPGPLKISVSLDSCEAKYWESIRKEIDYFLEKSEDRFVFTVYEDYLTPAIESGDMIGVEKTSYNELLEKKSSLITSAIPPIKNSIFLTAVDEAGELFATNLTLGSELKKTIIKLNKNDVLYRVSWIRKSI